MVILVAPTVFGAILMYMVVCVQRHATRQSIVATTVVVAAGMVPAYATRAIQESSANPKIVEMESRHRLRRATTATRAPTMGARGSVLLKPDGTARARHVAHQCAKACVVTVFSRWERVATITTRAPTTGARPNARWIVDILAQARVLAVVRNALLARTLQMRMQLRV